MLEAPVDNTVPLFNPFAHRRDCYIERIKPLFFPSDPISDDIIRYFASLLRVLGLEDGGWDPYAESRALLNDIDGFFEIELPPARFKEPNKTVWRLGLLLYSHVVEMDAPYEVLTNLLRFQLRKGYNPDPFFSLLSAKEQERYAKRGISTGRKIEIIKQLSSELGVDVGDIFDDFYDSKLRNAIAHSNYILADKHFRCRGNIRGIKTFTIDYKKLEERLLAAKAFIVAFFQSELLARREWGLRKNQAFSYDPHHKGLMEILVDNRDLMCGFKVHWPNNSESMYRRTDSGIDMVNCMTDLEGATIRLSVGPYAHAPSTFSPLVEHGAQPVYTKLEGSDGAPRWLEET